MADSKALFPLEGVIGIIDSSDAQLAEAIQRQLRCVEIRADLLLQAGLPEDSLLELVQDTKAANLACLFTYRHADQGGVFDGAESERVALCSHALEKGADIIDLEHGTKAANAMFAIGAPMILSYHDFERMLTTDELNELSRAMEASAPLAVKIIPTGASYEDAATMLSWVSGAGENIARIGFTMGSEGGYSRILARAHGAPITYASFGAPVAPGQIDIDMLLKVYRVMDMSTESKLVGVVGEPKKCRSFIESASVKSPSNDAYDSQKDTDAFYVDFSHNAQAEVEALKNTLRLSEIVYL